MVLKIYYTLDASIARVCSIQACVNTKAQSSQEWTSPSVHPKVKPDNTQKKRLLKKKKSKVLKFMTLQLEEKTEQVTCLEGLPGESFFPRQRTLQHSLGF